MFPIQLRSSDLLLSKSTLCSYFSNSKVEFGVSKGRRKPSIDSDTRTVTMATATDNDTWSLNDKSIIIKSAEDKEVQTLKLQPLSLYGIQEKATQTDISFTETHPVKHSTSTTFEFKSRKRVRPESSNKLEEEIEQNTFRLKIDSLGRLRINKMLKEDI